MLTQPASKSVRVLIVIALSYMTFTLLQGALNVYASPAITPRAAQPLDVVINEIAWSGTTANGTR